MEIKGVTDKKVDQLVAAASKISEFTFIVSGAFAHSCSRSAARRQREEARLTGSKRQGMSAGEEKPPAASLI